jgi:hypothetical protein
VPVDVDLLARLSSDRALASVTLFPHRHPQRECAAHIEIMDLWRSADPLIQIEGFRGLGKTTKAEEAFVLGGVFKNYPYALLIGETYEKACDRLSTIVREVKTNAAMVQAFGGRSLVARSIENKLWFSSGALIQACGWDQELQSFKEGSHRPHWAWLDDVENLERVRDAAAVDASMSKLYGDLLPAMDPVYRKVVNSQTARAQDCMVKRLAANPQWVYRSYPICDRDPDDPEAIALWPERFPIELVRQMKAEYVAAGKLDDFLLAYMLQTTNPDSKTFKRDWLQSMDSSPWHWMARYAIYDPARSTNRTRTRDTSKSDQYGKVVISMMGSKILVHESQGAYWKPDEFMDDLFTTNERHHPVKMGVEKNSLDDWIVQPIQLQILRRGVTLPLVALQAPQDQAKDDFIKALQPFMQSKDIVLIGGLSAHPQLVSEVENFPQGQRNVLNALAYAFKLVSGAPMYEDFGPDNIAADSPEPPRGETINVAFNANATTVVAVAILRQDRRIFAVRAWSAAGPITDAVETVVYNARASFPLAKIQAWAPADLHDQWQRVALVPSMKRRGLVPYRGEHIAPARGCLSERIRNTWHGKRLFLVDRKVDMVLNALSAGYARKVEKGGGLSREPEEGESRLVAEALETMISVLDHTQDTEDGVPEGANTGRTKDGRIFISARPQR